MNKDKWIRISELEKRSGVSRRTIHFYLQEGILHPPVKTGKTMAYYDESHIARLRDIRDARSRGLPLAAIRDSIFASGVPDSSGKITEAGKSADSVISRPRKGANRERIMELGSRFFRTRGYRQTRVSDITTAMSVGKGTFYFYFKDKTELFLECAPRIFNELFAAGWDRIRQIENPVARLETRASMVMPVLREFCAILQLSREAMEEPDPKLKALGEQIYCSIRRPIISDIEKGIQSGLFRIVDATTAATMLIGIMESLSDLQRIDNRPLTPETWQHISDLIIKGMIAHPDDCQEKSATC